MANDFRVFSSKLEDGFSITDEEGNRLEAAVVHLGSQDTLIVGTSNTHDFEETYQELLSTPLDAA